MRIPSDKCQSMLEGNGGNHGVCTPNRLFIQQSPTRDVGELSGPPEATGITKIQLDSRITGMAGSEVRAAVPWFTPVPPVPPPTGRRYAGSLKGDSACTAGTARKSASMRLMRAIPSTSAQRQH